MVKTIGDWDLRRLLENVHNQVEAHLDVARRTIGHPTDKGDSSESVWIDLFNTYLPRRYHTIKGHIADSEGNFSEQIDVIIHDRHFTPLIFTFKDVLVVPAESVYAVFESKQQMDASNIRDAKKKLSSVRRLTRTNNEITALGIKRQRAEVKDIFGGMLALGSAWADPFGVTFQSNLQDDDPQRLLDIGCIASKGMFVRGADGLEVNTEGKHATRFLFKLMNKLQLIGSVPAIEMDKYEPYLGPEPSSASASKE